MWHAIRSCLELRGRVYSGRWWQLDMGINYTHEKLPANWAHHYQERCQGFLFVCAQQG